ncbi:hypothetical protein [Microbulbifer elongatus]|uniref:hypothetical protein n=1 Tax=Microbulbifer elongatus TaxID=86173 RepID=UPI001CFCADB5|nr:hypothetical protein [Microbulbifer elongatus]
MKNYAIEADYYMYGIKLGILGPELAISWAYRIIEKEDDPSGEVIEVALSKSRGRNGIIEALCEVEGVRDSQLSGGMLLLELLRRLENGASPASVSTNALSVVRETKFPEDLIWQFNVIDDEVLLAEQGIYTDKERTYTALRDLLRSPGVQKT